MLTSLPVRWQKFIALSMLVWAITDLSVPGLCVTEDEKLPPSLAASRMMPVGDHLLVYAANSNSPSNS